MKTIFLLLFLTGLGIMAKPMRVVQGSHPFLKQIDRPKTAGKTVPPAYQRLLEQEIPTQSYTTTIDESNLVPFEPIHQTSVDLEGHTTLDDGPATQFRRSKRQASKTRATTSSGLVSVDDAQKVIVPSPSESFSVDSDSIPFERKGPGRPRIIEEKDPSLARKRMRNRNYYNQKRGKALESMDPDYRRHLRLTLEERERRSQDAKTRLYKANLDYIAARKAANLILEQPPSVGERNQRTKEEEAAFQYKVYKRQESARQRVYKKEKQHAIQAGLPIPIRQRGKRPIENPTPEQAKKQLAYQRWRDKKGSKNGIDSKIDGSKDDFVSVPSVDGLQSQSRDSASVSGTDSEARPTFFSWHGSKRQRSRQRRREDFTLSSMMI